MNTLVSDLRHDKNSSVCSGAQKKNKGKPLEVQYDEVQKCANDMVQTVLMMNIQEVNLSPPQMHYLNLNEAAPR